MHLTTLIMRFFSLQVKEGEVVCVFCRTNINVCEWDGHFCNGMEDYTESTSPVSPTLSEVVDAQDVVPASPSHVSISPSQSDDDECLPRVSLARYLCQNYYSLPFLEKYFVL